MRTFVTRGMGTGIKVERVSNIILTIRHLVVDSIVRELVPAGVTDQDQVVRILADRCDHSVRIGSNFIPALAGRFVEHFKNHVVITTPLLGHSAKERLCAVHVGAGLVAMVVDNHVDVVIDGRLYHGIHHALILALVRKIVTTAPVLVHAHSSTDNLDVLSLDKSSNRARIPEVTHIASNAPEQAHALHLDFATALDALATAINTALTCGVFASHKLPILTYRSDTTK